jgi:hypothetical protein
MVKRGINNTASNNFNTRIRQFQNALTSDVKKVTKQSKVQLKLPTLAPGVGMMCTRAGYTRYLNEIQSFFENKRFFGRRINPVVYTYTGDTNIGYLVNKPTQILRNNPKFQTFGNSVPMINANPTGIYYFMVFAMNNTSDTMGHAINILVDPSRITPRIWVFDPHGADSMINSGYRYGKITREKIVPNIKKMFGDAFSSGTTSSYYTGPNLQLANTRGVCTTFYISFTYAIMDLLMNTITINDLGRLAPNSDNLAARIQFLNRPGNDKMVTNKVTTAVNTPRGIYMTMGKKSPLKRNLSRKKKSVRPR